jgi:signal transduction histidine kinase
MPEGLRELLVGDWWRYTISGLGALMLAFGGGSVLLDGRLTSTELVQLSSLVVLCLLLIALGSRIAVDVRSWTQMVRVLAWMSFGVLAMATLGGWYHAVVQTADSEFEIALLFLSVLAAGALFGSVVGYYEVRVRALVERASREEARSDFLDEQQETLSSLNRIFRHQILNDLSAISGRSELLAADKIDADRAADSIIEHSEHMEATVERLETIIDVLTHVSATSDVSVDEAIERATETAHESHPTLTIDTAEVSDVTVRADELLSLAIAEVLENAADHGDGAPTVTVTETVDAAIIEISDDGPGIDMRTDSLFDPNSRGPESDGDGLGLFLADLIVQRYNGAIRLTEGDDGATFEIEVPTDSPLGGQSSEKDADNEQAVG